MKGRVKYLIGFAAILGICALAFVMNPTAEFGGADGEGEELITEMDPDHEPWFSNLWEPPSETESLLFALQAAIGAIIIGYFIGNESGKRSAMSSRSSSASQGENARKDTTDEKAGNA